MFLGQIKQVFYQFYWGTLIFLCQFYWGTLMLFRQFYWGTLSLAPKNYILRLINGDDVKVQKMVGSCFLCFAAQYTFGL